MVQSVAKIIFFPGDSFVFKDFSWCCISSEKKALKSHFDVFESKLDSFHFEMGSVEESIKKLGAKKTSELQLQHESMKALVKTLI